MIFSHWTVFGDVGLTTSTEEWQECRPPYLDTALPERSLITYNRTLMTHRLSVVLRYQSTAAPSQLGTRMCSVCDMSF